MAGIFSLKKGAFDSSEAASLHEAYVIALQGLRATHDVDAAVMSRLAGSIVRVARAEPDCLRNDGTIDPVRLAQRAVLRMLQLNAPHLGSSAGSSAGFSAGPRAEVTPLARPWIKPVPAAPDTAAKPPASATSIILKIFDRTSFAKL